MNTKSMYDLMLELVRVPSVSPGPQEATAARLVYDTIASLPYFGSNPHHLWKICVPQDRFGRSSVAALVRAAPETKRTIMMIGHLDVVETAEARDLASLMFRPEEYTGRLGDRTLPDDVRRDLESGHYLFGRGVFDMKCGVAAEMELLRKYARDPGGLDHNLLVLLVCDEENQSAGMLSAIEYLFVIVDQENLDILACVNTEGETQRGLDDTDRYVSLGTVGKLMPVFYCVGKESHVGSHHEGLNANFLASAVNMVLEGSPLWADVVGDEVYPPPTALKHRDLRDVYSVTLPARAVTYFNYLFVNKTPAQVLQMMITAAEESFSMALGRLQERTAVLLAQKGRANAAPLWRPKVLTFDEVLEAAKVSFQSLGRGPHSTLDDHLRAFAQELPEGMDPRDKCIDVMSETLHFYPDKSPMIIVGFLPPFYPHRTNLRETPRELGLLGAVDELISFAKKTCNETLVTKEHFVAISDLSYVGFHGTRNDILPLVRNTPGWGTIYRLPIDALLKFDIPVVNIGPSGKDAHKYTERLDLRYYLGAYPRILEHAVKLLSRIP